MGFASFVLSSSDAVSSQGGSSMEFFIKVSCPLELQVDLLVKELLKLHLASFPVISYKFMTSIV